MRSIILLILFGFSTHLFGQMASHKFLQLRDFTGGVKPNGTYFVDKVKYDDVKGSPYMFEEFVPCTLYTTDSGVYELEKVNINLFRISFEILEKNQAFFFDNEKILSIKFNNHPSRNNLDIRYFPILDKFGEILYDGSLKLILVNNLEVKEPDYRSDLNIGSKSTILKKKKFYYLQSGGFNFSPLNTKRDFKKYLKEYRSEISLKNFSKNYSIKTQEDLVKTVRELDSF